MKRRLPIAVAAAVLLAAAAYFGATRPVRDIVLTGVVTTDDVIVSSEVQGRLQELRVREGDRVQRGELLGVIQPEEWKADMAYYADSERQSAAQVTQAEADLRYQEAQTRDQTRQAEANLAAATADVTQGQADLENARLSFERERALYRTGVESAQAYDQARTAFAAAKAHVEALRKQGQAAQAALALAQSNANQIAARRAALEADQHRLAAAGAQKRKAAVHLGYTEIHAPITGVVDVRAALPGEVVTPGQGIVTLIDPDDLWVRADVEETYIDRVHLGDRLAVRLPSGAVRQGTVFYRGVDADYATQRDVSHTKRDIKTFEVRLRCDNRDRSLAVGMTAYVTLPLETDHREERVRR
jgi:HlyD family secretion protein